MIRRLFIIVAVFAVGALGSERSFAQAALSADLLAVDSAFVNGNYERVELLALRILRDNTALTADETARLNLTAGYALIMLNREEEARRYFSRALDAVPDLVLDPVQVSPKFRVIFDEVKVSRPAKRESETPKISADTLSRPAAKHFSRALRSNLLIPGSGQWQLRHPVRGAIFFAAEAAAVTLLITSISEMRGSRADYLAEMDAERARKAYDRYNADYQTAWLWGICSAAVYVAAQADLARLAWPSQTMSVAPMRDAAGVSLAVRW